MKITLFIVALAGIVSAAPNPAPVPTYTRCGGIAGLPCPKGFTCIDDPRDTCNPAKGGADCIGICVATDPKPYIQCGGFAGLACPAGYKCVDDPRDDCNPLKGGADCIGICVA
ncbi:hypothetical protein ABW20_dc0106075 [Dactylellina cionopaga]|nr:hypothetical protein ABW20_dc0106075 [Dactylellina cionopaga]